MIISDHDILTSKKDVAFLNSSFCQPTVFPKIFYRELFVKNTQHLLWRLCYIFTWVRLIILVIIMDFEQIARVRWVILVIILNFELLTWVRWFILVIIMDFEHITWVRWVILVIIMNFQQITTLDGLF